MQYRSSSIAARLSRIALLGLATTVACSDPPSSPRLPTAVSADAVFNGACAEYGENVSKQGWTEGPTASGCDIVFEPGPDGRPRGFANQRADWQFDLVEGDDYFRSAQGSGPGRREVFGLYEVRMLPSGATSWRFIQADAFAIGDIDIHIARFAMRLPSGYAGFKLVGFRGSCPESITDARACWQDQIATAITQNIYPHWEFRFCVDNPADGTFADVTQMDYDPDANDAICGDPLPDGSKPEPLPLKRSPQITQATASSAASGAVDVNVTGVTAESGADLTYHWRLYDEAGAMKRESYLKQDAFSGLAGGRYYAEVMVTDRVLGAFGLWEQPVDVAAPPSNAPQVTISGPTLIVEGTTRGWNATVSPSDPGFTYRWVYRVGTQETLYGTSTSEVATVGGQSFEWVFKVYGPASSTTPIATSIYPVTVIPASAAPKPVINGLRTVRANNTCTWTASIDGGTAPYTYKWYRMTSTGIWRAVASTSSYTGNTGTTAFQLKVVMVDAADLQYTSDPVTVQISTTAKSCISEPIE